MYQPILCKYFNFTSLRSLNVVLILETFLKGRSGHRRLYRFSTSSLSCFREYFKDSLKELRHKIDKYQESMSSTVGVFHLYLLLPEVEYNQSLITETVEVVLSFL